MRIASGSAEPADSPYWRALADGKLIIQHCQGCGLWLWPAAFRCGSCGTWEPEWTEVPFEGEIYSWTKTWHRFGGTEGLDLPYVSVLASLPAAGGTRLLGLYAGGEDELRVGRPLAGSVEQRQIGGRLLSSIKWSAV